MSIPAQELPDTAIGVIDISGLGGLIAVRRSMEQAPVSVDEDSQALPFAAPIPDITLQVPETGLNGGGKDEENDVPITALTVSVYGNSGIPELTTFTVEQETSMQRPLRFQEGLERSLTAGIWMPTVQSLLKGWQRIRRH